jgi:hypothetical protein
LDKRDSAEINKEGCQAERKHTGTYDYNYCFLKKGNEVTHNYGEFARFRPLLKNIKITPDKAPFNR